MDYKLEYTPATGYFRVRTFAGWDANGSERWDFLRDRNNKPLFYGWRSHLATSDIITITDRERIREIIGEEAWETCQRVHQWNTGSQERIAGVLPTE